MVIRFILFSGLILHKVIWEVWKRKYPPAPAVRADSHAANPPSTVVSESVQSSLQKRIVKLCKIGFLLFLIAQSLFLDVFTIADSPSFLKYIGLALFLGGLAISILGRVQLGENWIELEERQVLPKQVVVTNGIYRYIRHPIYAGDVLLVTGLELALNSWLFLSGILIAMIVLRQAQQEEALLAEYFPEYSEYCLRTKRFVPFVV